MDGNLSRRIGVVGLTAVLAAVSVIVMWLLEWHQHSTLGLDIVLWAIAWFLIFALYWGLPATEGLRIANKLAGTVAIVLGLAFTYLFKAVTPEIVGGSVEEYPLMSLTFVAWTLVFAMLFVWLSRFWSAT